MKTENLSIPAHENLDENITDYIKATLGDSHINWSTLLPLSIIYSIFLIVGVFGNLSTCIVIISNEYMRTPTNIYLLNMAIADIATLIKNTRGVAFGPRFIFFEAQKRWFKRIGLNLWFKCRYVFCS